MKDYRCYISLGGSILIIALLLFITVGCSQEDKQISEEQMAIDAENEKQELIDTKNEAQALFDAKNYEQAYEKFNELATNPKSKNYPEVQAELMYWVAYSLDKKTGKQNEALKHYVDLLTQFPKSRWADSALFNIGLWFITKSLNSKLELNSFEKLRDTLSNTQNTQKIREFAQLCIMYFHYEQKEYRNALHAYPFLVRSILNSNSNPYGLHTKNDVYDPREDIEPYNRYLKENMWYIIGDAHYKLKNYKAARQAFREFLKLLPGFDSVYNTPFAKAMDVASGTPFDDRSDNMRPLEVRHLIAQSFFEEKNYAEAYREFDKLTMEEFRGNSERSNSARSILEWSGFDDFSEDLRKDSETRERIIDSVNFDVANSYLSGIRKEEKYAEAMYKAAYCLKELGVNDEAIGRYTEFMTQFPDSEYVTEAYFDKGAIYANQQTYDSARLNYNAALRRTTDANRQSEIQLAIGQTYYTQGDYENAITQFNRLVEKYPKSSVVVDANLLIANSHNRKGTPHEAIGVYESIIKKQGETGSFRSVRINEFPKKPQLIALCYYEIGEAYYGIGNFAEALNWYLKVVSDFPIDALAPDALYGGMLALKELGNNDQLENIARKYIDDRNENDTFLAARIKEEVSVKVEEDKNSQDIFLDFAKATLKNAEYKIEEKTNALLMTEATFNFAQVKREEFGDLKGAAKEFAKLTSYRPIPDIRLDLVKLKGKYYEGLCYEEADSRSDAKRTYQEALTLFNTNFQPFINASNLELPNIDAEVINYCIRTAKKYAEKIQSKLKDTEQKPSDNTDKEMDSFDMSDNPNSLEKSRIEKRLTAKDISEIVSTSTVFIEIEGITKDRKGKIIDSKIGTGSGFFVGPGLIATNYHVIDSALRGTARLVRTEKEYAIIGYTAIDPDRDLAILKVRAFGAKPLPLGDSEEVHRGDSVYPVGNPLGLVNVVSDGQISSIQWVKGIRKYFSERPEVKSSVISDVQRNNTPHKLLMMTAPISPGNSGGPVLNSKGEVVGVSVGVKLSGQNLNYAVPINYLEDLLKQVSPARPLSDLEIVY